MDRKVMLAAFGHGKHFHIKLVFIQKVDIIDNLEI